MKVSVFGLGYVGSVTAACLADLGHHVVGVDVNPAKAAAINQGHSPVLEPGLDELIRCEVDAGKLRAIDNTAEGVAASDVLLICVGTPSDENGNLNFEYLDRVCEGIGDAMRDHAGYKVIAIRSTLLPGVVHNRLLPILAARSQRRVGEGFGVVTNPEFLRESSAIEDFRNPPFTLIGEMDRRAGDVMAELYAGLQARVIRTDPDAASLVKYASNAFHALKITFANEMGQICKRSGVDATEVMDIFCQDTRLNISPRYLRPGFAFGGSCLPKDLRALLYHARHNDLSLPVLESIMPSNRQQIQNTVDRILRDGRRNVAMIGLTFKPGTDDLRESPSVELVEALTGKGLKVRIYDEYLELEKVVGRNRAFIERALPHIASLLCESLEETLEGSDIVVVAHKLRNGQSAFAETLRPDQLVVDMVKLDLNGNRPAGYEGILW